MIAIVRITRIETDPGHGTFGVLTLNGESLCVTLEPYDQDNTPGISCIPAGQYICTRYSSDSYPDHWEIRNVPGRYKILMHAGNTDDNTAGCVLLASYFGKLRGDRAVLNSGATLNKFMDATRECDKLKLTIAEAY